MGGQEGRDDIHGCEQAELPSGPEHLQFVVERQPIARLDLNRRNAFSNGRMETRQGGFNQLRLAHGPGGADGGQDAPAQAGDFSVGDAASPHCDFGHAVAAVDEMRVAIHKSWCDPRPGEVNDFGTFSGRFPIRRPHPRPLSRKRARGVCCHGHNGGDFPVAHADGVFRPANRKTRRGLAQGRQPGPGPDAVAG